MPTGQRAPADPTQGEVAAGRCANCGAVILEGDSCWQGEDEELYCDSWCAAEAHCQPVTLEDGRRVYSDHYTRREAVRFTKRYWSLLRRARELRELYLGTAKRLREQGMVAEAWSYEQHASDIERWLLEDEPPAYGGDRAGDSSTENGAELGHSAPSS